MLVQVVFFSITRYFDWNFYQWLSANHNSYYQSISDFLRRLFFFCVYNIIFIGLSGVYQIISKKKIALGILALIAAVAYLIYGLNIIGEY
jgi:hypothetical protein